MNPDPERVCFFGSANMGSWKIRAEQIAATRPEWRSAAELDPNTIKTHGVFCLVKRRWVDQARLLHRLGRTVIYDVVDCWQQPEDGLACHDVSDARRLFGPWFQEMDLDGVVFANRTMMEDLGDLVPNPTYIYHHGWPGLAPIEVRRRARVVGYEGRGLYLGEWQERIHAACKRLGLRFVVNPKDLRSIDIGISVRGGPHANFLAHRYKSNVKLANFYRGGIPCLMHGADVSYQETDNGQVRFFKTEEEMELHLRELMDHDTRMEIHRSFVDIRERFSVERMAAEFADYIHKVRRTTLARPADVSGGTE